MLIGGFFHYFNIESLAYMTNREKPYSGSSRQRLTDLINAVNGESLIEGIDFEYGVMRVGSNQPGSNTRVVLQSKREDRVDTEVHYTRLGIDVLAHLPPEFIREVVIDELPFSIHKKLDEINESLGLNLVATEVEDIHFQDERDEYPLRIAPNQSLAWRGSEFNFKVRRALDLASTYPNNTLVGLVPPPPVNNSPNFMRRTLVGRL